MPSLEWKLDASHKMLTVTLPTDPPFSMNLDASAVEGLVKNLASSRSLMQPAIPSTFAKGQTSEATPDPAWVAEQEAKSGKCLLHVRDPRFGWLHFLLTSKDTMQLADRLKEIASAAAPQPARGNGS